MDIITPSSINQFLSKETKRILLGIPPKPKQYRCKVCGTFTVEKSDKKNICIECRKEYLRKGC